MATQTISVGPSRPPLHALSAVNTSLDNSALSIKLAAVSLSSDAVAVPMATLAESIYRSGSRPGSRKGSVTDRPTNGFLGQALAVATSVTSQTATTPRGADRDVANGIDVSRIFTPRTPWTPSHTLEGDDQQRSHAPTPASMALFNASAMGLPSSPPPQLAHGLPMSPPLMGTHEFAVACPVDLSEVARSESISEILHSDSCENVSAVLGIADAEEAMIGVHSLLPCSPAEVAPTVINVPQDVHTHIDKALFTNMHEDETAQTDMADIKTTPCVEESAVVSETPIDMSVQIPCVERIAIEQSELIASGNYTVYHVCVQYGTGSAESNETTTNTIRRRYREFLAFHTSCMTLLNNAEVISTIPTRTLKRWMKQLTAPDVFPPKVFFAPTRPSVVTSRKERLEAYLNVLQRCGNDIEVIQTALREWLSAKQ